MAWGAGQEAAEAGLKGVYHAAGYGRGDVTDAYQGDALAAKGIVFGVDLAIGVKGMASFGAARAKGQVSLAGVFGVGKVKGVGSGSQEASSSLQALKLREHSRLMEKYGSAGYRELQNGRIRYYGEIKTARTEGEMVGARLVRGWDPVQNKSRTWYETLDRDGNVRSVAPKLVTEPLNHRIFDINGNYIGRR